MEGRAIYTVGESVDATYIAEWKDWNDRSFMLGLLVDVATGQEAEVEYRTTAGDWFPLDRELVPGGKHDIVGQLKTDPGTPPGKRWIGFSQPAGPDWALDVSKLAEGQVSFDVRVRIFPSTGPEFITFVGRHLRDKDSGVLAPGKFENGHLPSSWYVPQMPREASEGKLYVYGPRGRRMLPRS